MTTSKTLRLNFINGENKKTALMMPNAALDLTKEEVLPAMQLIADENIFNRNGVDLYSNLDSAQYVERTITPLFDNSSKE